MKVLNLRKSSEKSTLAVLITLAALLLFILKSASKIHPFYELLLLAFTIISFVVVFLMLSSKKKLTIGRHGIFYSSAFGKVHIDRIKLN